MEPTNKKDTELERVLAAVQNSPKEQGLSAADPLFTPTIEGLILGRPLQWLGKGVSVLSKKTLSKLRKPSTTHMPFIDIAKGSVDDITDGVMSVTSPDIGEFIGMGAEQAVFNHATDPTKVVKVFAVNTEGLPNMDAVRRFHDHFIQRNEIPFSLPNTPFGFLRKGDGLFPIYLQDKVTPLPKMKYNDFEKTIAPKLKKQLKSKGYKEISKDNYSNGKFTLSDLTEENMAYDKNGQLVFFDLFANRK